MVGWLAGTLMAVSLAVAVWFLLLSRWDKSIQAVHLLAMAIVELGLVGQAVVATVQLAGGHDPAERATFIGYLAASLILLPIGAFLAVGERSKWGTVAAAVTSLAVPVMILRMLELWSPTGA
ncbi:hypothetical protein LO762_09895 [Actinocorallia sp. API 0066]|uniref:hypothetical protein n=1 Tax=Actinocorallia sp. API 0066 TaxID=2896846 RepID=UPI001E5F09BF|nr:hypothetical protein [Actinocorallia sp. API 0066]MCD0449501.1 hypothetical protein [Actinocorallia sp. API 0066]